MTFNGKRTTMPHIRNVLAFPFAVIGAVFLAIGGAFVSVAALISVTDTIEREV